MTEPPKARGRPPARRRLSADAKWVREQREALGLTQAALAERLGLAGNTIARIERDQLRPEWISMLRLAIERLIHVEPPPFRPEA